MGDSERAACRLLRGFDSFLADGIHRLPPVAIGGRPFGADGNDSPCVVSGYHLVKIARTSLRHLPTHIEEEPSPGNPPLTSASSVWDRDMSPQNSRMPATPITPGLTLF